MRRVSREEIIETWERLCGRDEKQSRAVAAQFMQEQPALGIFLAASTEGAGEGAQDRPVIELAMAFWEAMTKVAGRPLTTASPDDIDRAEEANTRSLEQLAEASEMEWKRTVEKSFQSYNQRELLGFGMEVLMAGHEDAPELAPENIGIEMLWLKTVIDCLDR